MIEILLYLLYYAASVVVVYFVALTFLVKRGRKFALEDGSLATLSVVWPGTILGFIVLGTYVTVITVIAAMVRLQRQYIEWLERKPKQTPPTEGPYR